VLLLQCRYRGENIAASLAQGSLYRFGSERVVLVCHSTMGGVEALLHRSLQESAVRIVIIPWARATPSSRASTQPPHTYTHSHALPVREGTATKIHHVITWRSIKSVEGFLITVVTNGAACPEVLRNGGAPIHGDDTAELP
jgi:hypothetical protein